MANVAVEFKNFVPEIKAEMENYSKAFIQEYTNRMIDNRMCE